MNYKHASHVHYNNINNEIIILDGLTDAYLALNEVAGTIWEAIGEGLDESAIAVRVANCFDVDAEQAAEDVAEFFNILVSRGLIDAAQHPGAHEDSHG